MDHSSRKLNAVGNIHLTDRDILWIRAVHRFRFITTDQAQMLSKSANRNAMNKRLADLAAHGYLDRLTELERKAFGYAKKRHAVHALGQRGAKWLSDNDGITFPKGKGWHTANKLKSAERLVHQIGVVDTVLLMEQAVRRVDGLDLTHQDELLAMSQWPDGLKPYRLPTKQMQQGHLLDRGTDPDYTFSVSRMVADKRQNSLCFLEWDNSSENFIKANRLASSIAQKHRCYADAYQRQLHTELYGFKHFRVLFVVNGNAARVAKMQEVCQQVVEGAPKGIFWYTNVADLEKHGPLSDIWLTGEDKRLSLV